MRFSLSLLLAAVTLTACTASPLDTMNRLGTTAEAEPFPVGYKDLLRHQYGLNRPLDLEVSYPRTILADNAFEPARWYACVRTNAGAETLYVISGGKLRGTVRIPAASGTNPATDLCDGGTYEPLG